MTPEAITAARAELNALDGAAGSALAERLLAEIEQLSTHGTPGVMHEADRAFYKLTITERNHARVMAERWQTVANRLAERMRHHAYCDAHPEADAEPADCPFCADRAAYRLWQIGGAR